MSVHEIGWTDRLAVTARMIDACRGAHVLEFGSSEFSFEAHCQTKRSTWQTVDTQGDADYVCNFNVPALLLPIESNSLDVVICTEVLEHLLWPQVLLREIHRILKPQGTIVISVPNIVSLSYRLAWLLGRIPSCAACGNMPPSISPTVYDIEGQLVGGHVIDFNLARLEALCGLCAFSIIDLRGSGLIWHRQLLPAAIVPATLSSNLIAAATPTK